MILYYVNLCSIPFYYGIIYFSQQPYHIILFVICHVDIDIKYTHEHSYIWCSPFEVWYIKVFASRQVVRDPGKALKKLTPIEHLMTGGAAGGIDSLTIHGTGLTMNILFGCHGKCEGFKNNISFSTSLALRLCLWCVCVCLWQKNTQKKAANDGDQRSLAWSSSTDQTKGFTCWFYGEHPIPKTLACFTVDAIIMLMAIVSPVDILEKIKPCF